MRTGKRTQGLTIEDREQSGAAGGVVEDFWTMTDCNKVVIEL
jgi:hypothetical protein